MNDISNIEDLAGVLSIPSMLFVILIQSVSEEVFFRGFLMGKIDKFTGMYPAILIVAIIFGLAHISYGKYYPVIASIMIGIVLGFIKYKTKNLFSSIVAHLTFNFTAYMLYLLYLMFSVKTLTL